MAKLNLLLLIVVSATSFTLFAFFVTSFFETNLFFITGLTIVPGLLKIFLDSEFNNISDEVFGFSFFFFGFSSSDELSSNFGFLFTKFIFIFNLKFYKY